MFYINRLHVYIVAVFKQSCVWPLGFFLPKYFYIIWLSNLLHLRLPDEEKFEDTKGGNYKP